MIRKTTELSAYIVGSGSLARIIKEIFKVNNIEVYAFVDRETSTDPDFLIIETKKIPYPVPENTLFVIAISLQKHRQAAKKRLEKHGILDEKILEIKDASDAIFMGSLLKHNNDETINYLLSNSLSNIQALERAIIQCPIVDNTRISISFNYHGHGGGYRQHLNSIATKLSYKFNINCFSDEPDSSGEKSPNFQLQSLRTRRSSRSENLSIAANYIDCSHTETPKVLFMHEIYDHFTYVDEIIQVISKPKLQYVFTPSLPCFEKMKKLCIEKNLKNQVVLIPGGYPRLDNNIEYFKTIKEQPDSIIYAPTLSMFDSDNMESTYSMGKAPNILLNLSNSFPEYKIIFRPHPTDLLALENGRKATYRNSLEEAVKVCSRLQNCELDTSKTSYMKSYGSSVLMVSDISSTAFTYAFSTNRPVIFYSPGNSITEKNLPDTLFIADRSKLGICVNSEKDISNAAFNILEKYSEYSTKIKNHSEKVIFNKVKSESYFIENIDFILSNERNSDWWYLSDHR